MFLDPSFNSKDNSLIHNMWYLTIVCIGMEYFSKEFFLLEIVTFFGVFIFLASKNYKPKQNVYKKIILMTVIMLGIIISRLNVQDLGLLIMNIFFLFKMFVFFLFVYFYLTEYGFPFKTLYLIGLFVLPHILGLILGENVFLNNQFAGLHGDPNYLAPDLLGSFIASIFIFFSNGVNKSTRYFFGILSIISLIMILMTVSRTAFSSVCIIGILLFIKKSLSNNKSFFFKAAIFALFGFVSLTLITGDISKSVSQTLLYSRFFDSAKGADLIENERYIVWGISFETIQQNGLFSGYSIENFLKHKYHFVPHNAWLDIGIKEGGYTFWLHSVFYLVSLLYLLIKFLFKKGVKNIWNIDSFIFLFCFSIAFMMFSISVSHMYYYWFILFILFIQVFNRDQRDLIPVST